MPFVLRKKMDDARKEVNPDSFAPDDPRRPEQAIMPDWPAIQRMTEEALCSTSKDLMLAARLTESLTKQAGYGGMRDGFRLLRRMVDECWDRVHPIIEDNDLEPRASAFNWLADPDRGAFFPVSVRNVPIVHNEGAGYGWQHWRDLQEGKGKIQKEDFDKAVAAATRETCQTSVEDLASCLDEVNQLELLLDGKLAEIAPSLGEIRKALTDVQALAQEILVRKGPAPSQASAEEAAADEVVADGASPRSSATAAAPRRGVTREEVYARLAEASAQLIKMEPHSPVAYMIQRAVKLGQMQLPDLMKVLIQDQEVLKQLNRDLDLGYEQPE